MDRSLLSNKDESKPFIWFVIFLGSASFLLSACNFPFAKFDLTLACLALTTIFLGSRIGIGFTRDRFQLTASDTLIFLILFLYGGEAAVIVAAIEAFYSSFYFTNRALIISFNCAVLAFSTFVTSYTVNLIFGSPSELTKGELTASFVIVICVLAIVQYSVNSMIIAVRESLKTKKPIWHIWKDYFYWAYITYFAGASTAGITARLITGSGIYAFLVTVPIISIIYFAFHSYQKQLEAKTEQAAQAALHAEEQTRVSDILRQSEEHFRGAFDYAAVGMALIDRNGCWLRVNKSFSKLVGYAEKELLEMNFQAITHPDDLDGYLLDMNRLLEKSVVTVTNEKRYIHKSGHNIWTIISASTINDADGEPVHFVMQAQDITERKLVEEKLNHAAFYDSLTSLPNRALFTQHLQAAINKTVGREDNLYAVLFLDIDRFKNINDSLGHVIGDQLLIGVARRLEKCVRAHDVVSRFGGDEFAILLNNLNCTADATATATRIQKELVLPFNLTGYEVFSGSSLGVALSSPEYTQSEEILRDADSAMYCAKEKGKGRFEIFDKVMHSRAVTRLQLENDLRRAVERGEFQVYYQPIMNLQTNSISGFESLVRWQHPERGLVSPVEFIPVAEETELIIPLGNWVLLESCRQIREWQSQWDFPSPLTISVNLSGKQFKQNDLVEEIKRILRETKLDPQYLRLEITEGVVMDNAEEATAMLNHFRSLGVQLSIDDFGTGYSSLSYLHKFPVNILKVDRSFVSRMSVDEESLGIVETIIALASKLKMKVVAEGVETQAQSEQLKHFNCDFVQGFLYSKPVPAQQAQEFIEKEWQQLIKDGSVFPVTTTEQIKEINELYLM